MATRVRKPKAIGRPQGKSGLPAPVPGEPFSLIATLRRTRSTLTVRDAADLLLVSTKVIYKHINSGRIPVLDLGFDVTRIDPKAWAELLEHNNRHLASSARTLRAA